MEKKEKLFGDLNVVDKILLGLFALMVTVLDFFYIHWFSFRMALKHSEFELALPMWTGIIATVLLLCVRLLQAKSGTQKLTGLRYLLIIILFAAIVATFFHGYCPACIEVHDPVYKYIFELVYGHAYEYIG